MLGFVVAAMAKFASAGAVAQAATGVGIVLASVTGAGAAGVLPGPDPGPGVECARGRDAVRAARLRGRQVPPRARSPPRRRKRHRGRASPAGGESPGGSPAEFGRRVSGEAQDGGVDGQAVSERGPRHPPARGPGDGAPGDRSQRAGPAGTVGPLPPPMPLIAPGSPSDGGRTRNPDVPDPGDVASHERAGTRPAPSGGSSTVPRPETDRVPARGGMALGAPDRRRRRDQRETGQSLRQRSLPAVSLLATGGMGQVWRAQDLALERPVAVKVLRPTVAADAGAVTRFRREARLSAGLAHPNIATVHDYGEATRTPGRSGDRVAFLVMELVDGEPLSAVLRREGRLAPRTERWRSCGRPRPGWLPPTRRGSSTGT